MYTTCSIIFFSFEYVLAPINIPGYNPKLNSHAIIFLLLNNKVTFSCENLFSQHNAQVTLIPCFLCIPTISLYLIIFLSKSFLISFCNTLRPYINLACFFCFSLLVVSFDLLLSGFAACKASFQYCFS